MHDIIMGHLDEFRRLRGSFQGCGVWNLTRYKSILVIFWCVLGGWNKQTRLRRPHEKWLASHQMSPLNPWDVDLVARDGCWSSTIFWIAARNPDSPFVSKANRRGQMFFRKSVNWITEFELTHAHTHTHTHILLMHSSTPYIHSISPLLSVCMAQETMRCS